MGKNRLLIPALIAIQVLFGINFVTAKIVVGALPPLLWASLRIILASVFMVGACLALKRKHPEGGLRFFLPLIPFALLGAVINQGALLLGLHYTTATNSSVISTLIPIFTLIIVTLRGQEQFTARRGVGFTLALAGVLILRKIEQLTLSDQTVLGDALVIVSCLSTALFFSYGKKFSQSHDRLWTTAWMFIYGSIGLTLLALPDYSHFLYTSQGPALTPTLLGCMVFTVLGGTLLTYFLTVWTLAQAPPSSVAIFTYVQPVVTAALAWAWLDQPPTARTLFSSLLIFAGLLVALSKRAPEIRPLPAARETA
ncbi:MAG: DMT family transporter [Bdellovibrionia bacterium]